MLWFGFGELTIFWTGGDQVQALTGVDGSPVSTACPHLQAELDKRPRRPGAPRGHPLHTERHKLSIVSSFLAPHPPALPHDRPQPKPPQPNPFRPCCTLDCGMDFRLFTWLDSAVPFPNQKGVAVRRGVPHPGAPGPAGVPVLRAVGGARVDGGGPDEVLVRVCFGLTAGARLHDIPG